MVLGVPLLKQFRVFEKKNNKKKKTTHFTGFTGTHTVLTLALKSKRYLVT